MVENSNPLNKYFRQPSIYISLPSGMSYPPHVIQPTKTGELGVMPMTAKDEIRFKTPDALMNGQGIVDVIQSCIPDIKDAWQIKAYDLDTILMSIRIATYGETMDISFKVPVTNEEVSHTLNLPALLDDIKRQQMKNELVLKDGLKFTIRPLTYRDITTVSMRTFQEQKMYASIQESTMSEEEKTKKFDDAFKSLTELGTTIMLKNVEKITTPDGTEVTDPEQIKEFIDNATTTLITELQELLNGIRTQGSVKPVKLKATEEQIKNGAPANYEVPVTFDTANFFV
ncbi:MAG: hypothetical protein CMF96_07350 [Candidatus Marinimicrobia bacterium]|jgi:hypothetical protein|nr:hypothetical protein [Candidatus Neomarinimicrobiota bacterium]